MSVGDDHSLLDVAVDLEVFPQRLVRRVVGKTAHEELGPHRVFLIGVIVVVVVVVVAARVGGCGGHVGNNCGLWNNGNKVLEIF